VDHSTLYFVVLDVIGVPHILSEVFCILAKEHQINALIRDKEVRVIDEDGSQLGIMSSRDALQIAVDKNLDLVKIAPQAAPPVCRVMDYGKFRFEQSKKEKDARKNQKTVDIKEVRLSSGIDTHDFDFKVKNALRFLGGGDKVKASIRFRGRELAHTDLGRVMLDRFAEICSEISVIEKPAKLEGRQMIMFLAPKPVEIPKKAKAAKEGEKPNAETQDA